MFFVAFYNTVMLWILHSMVCKAEQRCTKYNVIFNQADVDRLYCIGTVCLRNDSNNCAAMICNDGVGLFAIGTAMIKSQHFQTMTLITKHKPIERLTGMVLMIKKNSNSSLAVWSLHGKPVWAAHDFKACSCRGVQASRHPR